MRLAGLYGLKDDTILPHSGRSTGTRTDTVVWPLGKEVHRSSNSAGHVVDTVHSCNLQSLLQAIDQGGSALRGAFRDR